MKKKNSRGIGGSRGRAGSWLDSRARQVLEKGWMEFRKGIVQLEDG